MKKKFTDKMVEINGCQPALDWAQGKTFVQAYTTSEKGEWMGYVFNNLNLTDPRRYKVAALCALEARDLMDVEHINLCNIATDYSDGKRTIEELLNFYKQSKLDRTYNRDNKDILSLNQRANIAAAWGIAGSISNASNWAASTGDEDKIQKECAKIIRRELPMNTWNLEDIDDSI